MPALIRCLLSIAVVFTLAGRAAAVDDTKGVDLNGMLKELGSMQQQQVTQSKATTQRAAAEAASAAGNVARAIELWVEAVRVTQFHGAAKETTQFREYLQKEGDAFKEHEVQVALHLYFNWLALTFTAGEWSGNENADQSSDRACEGIAGRSGDDAGFR